MISDLFFLLLECDDAGRLAKARPKREKLLLTGKGKKNRKRTLVCFFCFVLFFLGGVGVDLAS